MSNMRQNRFSLCELLVCLTNAEDLISHEVADHHQMVSYLALRMAEHLKLPESQKRGLMLAGLLHDAGALSLDERLELIESEPPSSNSHAFRGAQLLEGFAPLHGIAGIIRWHHIPWNNGEGRRFMGEPVPYLSHILHLADRIAVKVRKGQPMVGQVKDIQSAVLRQSNTAFAPELVDAFMEMSARECLWLDLAGSPLRYILPEAAAFDSMSLNIDEVVGLTRVFARVIDFRSPFTANHSAGVAQTAYALAALAGFSEYECKMMLIAGYLHDLGKLAVRNDILEKRGKLDETEYNIIKTHPYYTYRLLQGVKGFETVNQWASFHHERLNGRGYPFHLDGGDIPFGSRIMAVADIFTAISEDRPYRAGMPKEKALEVLGGMVKERSICARAMSILVEHFDEINRMRMEAQQKSGAEYHGFMDAPAI